MLWNALVGPLSARTPRQQMDEDAEHKDRAGEEEEQDARPLALALRVQPFPARGFDHVLTALKALAPIRVDLRHLHAPHLHIPD